ncbi:MAG: ACT domain-containing protein [Lachnospiraceae bacterium]
MKQLSIFVENKVGSLAEVTRILKEAGINLRAVASFDSPSYGILRVIVDDPEHARELLLSEKHAVKMTDVLAVELVDKPGALDGALQRLAEAGISINYVYSFVLRKEAEPLMVLHVSDMEQGRRVLQEAGLRVVDKLDS